VSRRSRDDAPVVYSSADGRVCRTCEKPLDRCRCSAPRMTPRDAPQPTGGVRVGRASKGRKGKPMTTIEGLPLRAEALAELARDLKRFCGSGGTVRDGVIEIQGEHRDVLVEELGKRGFEAKRSGG